MLAFFVKDGRGRSPNAPRRPPNGKPQERIFFGGLPQNPETSLQRTLRAVRSFQGFWVAGRRFRWGSATNEKRHSQRLKHRSFVGAALRRPPCLPQRPRRGLRALHTGCAGPKPATGKALPGRGAVWGRCPRRGRMRSSLTFAPRLCPIRNAHNCRGGVAVDSPPLPPPCTKRIVLPGGRRNAAPTRYINRKPKAPDCHVALTGSSQ